MANTIQQASSTASSETVRPSINERKFFESMKHLFASSFSVLGELMQNARRADATRIDFTVDAERKTATVQDDGCGITDFQMVIALCDSGWNEQVQQTDKPFGMGLFSLFFAAETVVFRSNGRSLTVGIEDIVHKRELSIQFDPDSAGKAGTRIDLMGLKHELIEDVHLYVSSLLHMVKQPRMIGEIRRRSRGFPIPVFINGVECERPDAQQTVHGAQTPIGFVSYPGVTCGSVRIPPRGSRRCYLQGLPIGMPCEGEGIVVHLDSTLFTARMPDRSHLFNHVEQEAKIDQALADMVHIRLAQLKATLDAKQFAQDHWENCRQHGYLYLMNDVPWIPGRCLQSVNKVSMESREVFYPRHISTEMVSREDFLSGAVKAWRGVPSGTEDHKLAALHLKVMQHLGVWDLVDDLGRDHWFTDVAPSVYDLRFTWEVVDAEDSGILISGDNAECQIHGAQSVKIKISSVVDDNYHQEVVINNDWVMVPTDAQGGHLDDLLGDPLDLICYVTGNGPSQDEPIDALSTYKDQHSEYRDEWRDKAKAAFWSAICTLRGAPLSDFVNTALRDAMPALHQKQAGHMCLVRAMQIRNYQGQLRSPTPDVINLMDDSFWTKVASAILPSGSEDEVKAQAETIRQAFTTVVQPGWQEPARSSDQ